MTDVLVILLTALLTAAAVMVVAALIARAQGRVAVVDVAWGAGFVLVALVTAVVGQALDAGDPARRWLVTALVTAWGLRLAWHIRKRAVGHGEDPRYEKLLGGPLPEVGLGLAVRKVFVVQGVAMAIISLPVAVGAVSEVAWWPLVWVGVAMWAVGLVFETVGDAQLAAYKADPDKPKVMDRGLWRYTRHPNYFGDFCVWWGLFLVAAETGPGRFGVIGPIVMSVLLIRVSGVAMLEKTIGKRRQGYDDYVRRTSAFFPRPPRPRAGP